MTRDHGLQAVPSLGRPLEVSAGVVEPVRALRLERRSGLRHPMSSGGPERLWLACRDGAMGGQANMLDFSIRGLGIVVNRAADRFVEALLEAKMKEATVDVSRIPGGRGRKARVVWDARTETREVRFGLELTEPLGDCLGTFGPNAVTMI